HSAGVDRHGCTLRLLDDGRVYRTCILAVLPAGRDILVRIAEEGRSHCKALPSTPLSRDTAHFLRRLPLYALFKHPLYGRGRADRGRCPPCGYPAFPDQAIVCRIRWNVREFFFRLPRKESTRQPDRGYYGL